MPNAPAMTKTECATAVSAVPPPHLAAPLAGRVSVPSIEDTADTAVAHARAGMALVIGTWSFLGHWSFVIGHSSPLP